MKLLSLIYGFIIFIRNKLYDFGIKKKIKIDDVNIICIGNIVVGGAGKTPAVQYFAKELLKQGKKIGILSRGYKGKRANDPFIVRDEEKILCTEKESGDEAYLHAITLNVPVVVSKNRVDGAILLRDKFNVDTIIMDDGFQHRRIIKDKSIILIDATNPFGGHEYLPLGKMRESLNALYRADEIIISKTNFVTNDNVEKIEKELKKYRRPIKKATFSPKYFINQLGEKLYIDEMKNKNVLIFSSIANPKTFYNTIKEMNVCEIEQIIYDDHYSYKKQDFDEIIKKSENYDYILTTEKDLVKINEIISKLYVLKMEFDIKNK